MAINRRFLYAGLFLMAIGAVVVAADLAAVTRGVILQALELWPLALIAIGAAVVVRRTSLSLPAGVLAAVAPGLLIGGGFALGPPSAGECGTTAAAPTPVLVHESTATRLIRVELTTGCGTSTITTEPGAAWRVRAARTDGRQPEVSDTGDGISVTSPGRGRRQLVLGTALEAWDIVLPTNRMEHLAITANANRMQASLPGAVIGTLSVDANASDVTVDATGASIDELEATANFSALSIRLPARTFDGDLSVNAGELRLCQPFGAAMFVTFIGDGPRSVTVDGLDYQLDEWQSERDFLSSHRIQLVVDVGFGSVDISTTKGCS